MTAQIPKKDTMKNTSNDPAFMLRWLNGTLSAEELSTLRNREEYEEMVSMQKIIPSDLLGLSASESKQVDSSKNDSSSKSFTFPTFTVIAFALFAVAILYVKLSS